MSVLSTLDSSALQAESLRMFAGYPKEMHRRMLAGLRRYVCWKVAGVAVSADSSEARSYGFERIQLRGQGGKKRDEGLHAIAGRSLLDD